MSSLIYCSAGKCARLSPVLTPSASLMPYTYANKNTNTTHQRSQTLRREQRKEENKKSYQVIEHLNALCPHTPVDPHSHSQTTPASAPSHLPPPAQQAKAYMSPHTRAAYTPYSPLPPQLSSHLSHPSRKRLRLQRRSRSAGSEAGTTPRTQIALSM
jgi:hypothetical protein